jgi:hypothetical protein
LNYNTKLTVNAAAGGSFMNLNVEDGYTLLEDITLNHQQWNPERPAPKAGIFQVDNSTLLSAQMDALTRQLAQMNSGASAANTAKPINAGNIFSCEHCGGMDHTTLECQLGIQEPGLDQVNALNNFGRPQNDPYSNTYNPGWRNHPNFSYKNIQFPTNSTKVKFGDHDGKFHEPTTKDDTRFKRRSSRSNNKG